MTRRTARRAPTTQRRAAPEPPAGPQSAAAPAREWRARRWWRWLRDVQVTTLLRRYRRDRLVVIAAFAMINGAVATGSIAAVALLTHTPFVFPSLGPTAFLVFTAPLAPAASPRNTLLGHTYGVAAGWLSLLLFHLADAPPALTAGVDWPRVGAAALSLSLTSGAMLVTRARHPPATATTLIISLGLMPRLWQVPVLLGAVLMLVVEAFAINRLAGLHYPLWAGRPDAPHLLRPPESATIQPADLGRQTQKGT